jgi:hypothetical protein
MCHRHRLGRRRAFVEQRCVGDLEPGQIDHHLLEIEERFETALAHFRLIRRIRGVPARIFQHIAQDHLGGDAAVIAHADHRGVDLVALGDQPELRQGIALRQGLGERQRGARTDLRRDHLVHEVLERRGADLLQHLDDIVRPRPDMARNEVRSRLQFAQAQP